MLTINKTLKKMKCCQWPLTFFFKLNRRNAGESENKAKKMQIYPISFIFPVENYSCDLLEYGNSIKSLFSNLKSKKPKIIKNIICDSPGDENPEIAISKIYAMPKVPPACEKILPSKAVIGHGGDEYSGLKSMFGKIKGCAALNSIKITKNDANMSKPAVDISQRVLTFSKKFDLNSIRKFRIFQHRKNDAAKIATMYKKIKNKIKTINSDKFDGIILGGLLNWRAKTIAKKTKLTPNPNRKYAEWLIPKFLNIRRGSRFTSKKIAKMRIGKNLTPQKRDVMLEMLYNRETILVWNFIEVGFIRSNVAPFQKIKIVPHEAWQIPNFPIPKNLIKKFAKWLTTDLKTEPSNPVKNFIKILVF